MRILSIETSCDETSLAIVEAPSNYILPERAGRVEGLPSFKIQKHLIASQVETHRPWGGVVPNLAKREHQINLPILFKKLFVGRGSPISPILRSKNRTKCDRILDFQKIDLIAVTVGPGLEPCLWQGIEFAKKIKKEHFPRVKIVSTNHLHGHMYSFLLAQKSNFQFPIPNFQTKSKTLNPSGYTLNPKNIFPAVQLLVSGGHTILLLMESLTKHEKLGETRDDAAGEAFDKVARMLNLPYPGGPEIERLASKYRLTKSIDLPRPMINSKNYDFSFSGLKTSVLYYLRDKGYSHWGLATRGKKTLNPIPYWLVANVAASFQRAIIDVLVTKALRAAKEYSAKSVILSGGVAANSALRKTLRQMSKVNGQMFISAPPKYQGDNAAIIAVAGYITHLRKKKYPLKAQGGLEL